MKMDNDRAYSVQLLAHKPVLIHQLWNLLLQPLIFLHQQLVHSRKFPVHTLKLRGLFSLLLPTPANQKNHKSNHTTKKAKTIHTAQIQNKTKQKKGESESLLPPILKPNLDLLRLNVGQNRALPNQLLPSQWTRLRAFHINLFQSFNLFSSVPHIFARRIKVSLNAVISLLLCNSHSHLLPNLKLKTLNNHTLR